MKLCFPIDNSGSGIFGHFASAPRFLILDTETGQETRVDNCDPNAPFAGCNAFVALSGRKLDGIVAGGMGDDVLRAMNFCGFRVYEARSSSIADNAAFCVAGELSEQELFSSHLEEPCGGGSCEHRCNHDH